MEIKTRHKRKCKECRKVFEVNRDWQIFCGNGCRYKFNKRYKEICFYCGQYGNHRHHVDPQTISGKNYFRGVETVYCCIECNTALSDHYFAFPYEGVEYIIDKYIAKYHLKTPAVEWDDEELQELGRNLRQHVKRRLAQRRRNEDRVIYLKAVKLYLVGEMEF